MRIVVRTRTDWANMDPDRFAAQDDPNLPIKWIRWMSETPLFEVWNEAFELGYFAYRERLQELGLRSCRAVRGATVTIGLDDAASWLEAPGDEILVPVDDDDFFRSDLADVAGHFDEGTDVVIWPAIHAGFLDLAPKRRIRRRRWPVLGPNNFALRKSYLVAHFDTRTIVRMLAHHYTADRKIAKQLGLPDVSPKITGGIPLLRHPTVRSIGSAYGMYNVHPGSIYFVNEILKKPEPVKRLRALDLDTPLRLPRYARGFEADVRRLEAEGRALRGRDPGADARR